MRRGKRFTKTSKEKKSYFVGVFLQGDKQKKNGLSSSSNGKLTIKNKPIVSEEGKVCSWIRDAAAGKRKSWWFTLQTREMGRAQSHPGTRCVEYHTNWQGVEKLSARMLLFPFFLAFLVSPPFYTLYFCPVLLEIDRDSLPLTWPPGYHVGGSRFWCLWGYLSTLEKNGRTVVESESPKWALGIK